MKEKMGDALSYLYSWTPTVVSNAVDDSLGQLIHRFAQTPMLRQKLNEFLFSKERKHLGKYDKDFGVMIAFPQKGIDEGDLYRLIEMAMKERDVWGNGRISGSVYHGAQEHCAFLAKVFAKCILFDKSNAPLVKDRQQLAQELFYHFQTSNPLHVDEFPLAVKAMAELAAMFASHFSPPGIAAVGAPASGAEEAIHLAMRAAKAYWMEKGRPVPVIALVGDDCRTQLGSIAKELGFATIFVPSDEALWELDLNDIAVVGIGITDHSPEMRNLVSKVGASAAQYQWWVHVHLDSPAFQATLSQPSGIDFSLIDFSLPGVTSMSFDTQGILYDGIAPVLYGDTYYRQFQFEAMGDWLGGLYFGLNAAGSQEGLKSILAYGLALASGMEGLASLAKEIEPPFKMPLLPKEEFEGIVKTISTAVVRRFHDNAPSLNTLDEVLDFVTEQFASLQSFPPDQARDAMEIILLDLMLSIFSVDSSKAVGRITSGGTESIKLAIRTYVGLANAKGIKNPVILMPKSAHIAFNRAVNDFGRREDCNCQIVDVPMTQNGEIDVNALSDLIDAYQGRVAAVVASSPSYPTGATDDIVKICALAQEKSVFLHIDECLGGFIKQLIPNPHRIDWSKDVWKGVTSISIDPHKYGFTPKGFSAILGLRESFSDFGYDPLMSIMPVSTLCHERQFTGLGVAIACLLKFGKSGYEHIAGQIAETGRNLVNAINLMSSSIPELEVVGVPEQEDIPHWVVAFRLKGSLNSLTYMLSKCMKENGWHLSDVGENTVHFALTHAQTPDAQPDFIDTFMSDLQKAVAWIKANSDMAPSTTQAFYGFGTDLIHGSGAHVKAELVELVLKMYPELLLSVPK